LKNVSLLHQQLKMGVWFPTKLPTIENGGEKTWPIILEVNKNAT
jgi:hypothetical protein